LSSSSNYMLILYCFRHLYRHGVLNAQCLCKGHICGHRQHHRRDQQS
jgi:hypothetical protein